MSVRHARRLGVAAAVLALWGCGGGSSSDVNSGGSGSDVNNGGAGAGASARDAGAGDASGGRSGTSAGGLDVGGGNDAAGEPDATGRAGQAGGVGEAGGPDATAGAGGGGTGPTDDDLALIDALAAEYDLLAPRSNPEQQPAMVAYASALPGVQQAGWTDAAHGDNFFVLFSDGTPFAILDNRAAQPDPALASETPAPAASLKSVPQSPKARLLYSLGTAFHDNTVQLQGMLQSAGYQVTAGSGELTSLVKDIQDDGYLYWDTHSGWVGEGAEASAIITTGTAFDKTVNASALVRGLWQEDSITLCLAATDRIEHPVDSNHNGKLDEEEKLVKKLVYSIKPSFIGKYFHFADNSVVLLDSCGSAHSAFSGAFIARNAGLYGGWDNLTVSSTRMPLLTDRMLGANVVPPIESPPERPFEYANVIAWMRKQGLDGAASAKLQLVAKAGVDAGILAPSIQSVRVTEGFVQNDPSTVTVNGIFGPKDDAKYQRALLVNGVAVHISGGDDRTIIADLPLSGEQAAGNFVVTVGGRISNEVPLSLYDLVMNYTFVGDGTLKIADKVHYFLRMDVHQFRTDVGAALSGDLEIFSARGDSSGTYTAVGSAVTGQCTTSWTGAGAVVVPTNIAVQPSVSLNGVLDVAAQQSLAFVPTFDPDPNASQETFKCVGSPTTSQSLDTGMHYDTDPVMKLLPQSGVLLPGSTTFTGSNGSGTLTWPTTVPSNPPSAKTKG